MSQNSVATAEVIAKKFMGQLNVYAPKKADQIDEQHWEESENWLASEVNKALQEAIANERERLACELERLAEKCLERNDNARHLNNLVYAGWLRQQSLTISKAAPQMEVLPND